MVKKYLIFLWLLVFTGGLGNIVSCAGDDNSGIGDLRISTQNLYLGTDLGPIVVAANAATAASTAAVTAGATAESIPAAAIAAAEAAATAAAAAGATEATIAAAVGTAIATAVGTTATPAIVAAVGTAVGALAAAQTALDDALDQILANDIGSRAVVIANIIARDEPDVIGLQEVSTFTLPSGIELNFRTVLQSALTQKGLSYKVAVEAEGADITVSTSSGMVSYKNSDVILVEDSLQVSDKEVKAYEDNIPSITVAGTVLSFPRSYARVTLQREGASPFVVVNTHLEANPAVTAIGAIQRLQATALGEVLTGITDSPVFLIGDLNSFAPYTGVVETGATSTSYEELIATGLTDAYLEANSATETTANSTCCYAADLNVDTDITDYGRVDHILYKGEGITASQVSFTGNEVRDRVTTSVSPARTIWPSDHLGVIGTFPGDL